jgi:hypothetical protein
MGDRGLHVSSYARANGCWLLRWIPKVFAQDIGLEALAIGVEFEVFAILVGADEFVGVARLPASGHVFQLFGHEDDATVLAGRLVLHIGGDKAEAVELSQEQETARGVVAPEVRARRTSE